ncbi:MAG: putative lipopolysaccharide heptosyltransferase III [Deltaproteobacteria bacterium GWC2_56_8]|nr:MAG: putative lipopolysaccharide heptosyltransferase III [Deltaproteobacteria bacterium GWB2_55_19]OGP34550.1 MAG: putative lipopolysaccharide heptosyltransferase III [Deltaproteobacteria bacterium GWC2_56_8]
MEFKGVNKILILKLRLIGDVLLTVPVIKALKGAFPGARISVLVNSGTEEMLTENPLIDEIIVFERGLKKAALAKRVKGELRLVKELRRRGFDMTVDLTSGDRPALLGFMTGARYRLGFDPAGKGFAGKKYLYTHLAKRPRLKHVVLRDLTLLEAFGIGRKGLSIDIYTSPSDEAFMERLLKEAVCSNSRFVHVHPTASEFYKCWTDEGMAQVMDAIEGAGLRAVVTSGPAQRELDMVASILSRMKTRPVDLSGRLGLKHLAVLSRRAVLFFGVDTAPMHIAAAVGTPVVALFGPSGAFDWGPWDNSENSRPGKGFGGDGEASIQSPYTELRGVQTSGAHTIIQRGWECVPCGKKGCKASGKSDCLADLTAEEVRAVIIERLKVPAYRGAKVIPFRGTR